MKKLWSLIFVLVLALGFSACEKEPPVTPPGPEPGPQGPTELPGSVTDLAYELNGYQEATLTWTNPEEEFELTGFVIKYRAEGGENAEITVDPDDYDAWPIEEFVVEGLEEQVYNFEVLTKNDYGTQKNGTALDGVKVYTLTGIEMPSFEIIEKSIGFVLNASNLSGATNVYYGMDWELKSSDGTVVASGENVIDEELFANIEAKNSTLANVDLPIDGVLDEEQTYTVAYTLYAYPALDGVIADGVYTYESILDMGDEPASVEGTAEGLTAKAEVEPMVIHFWGGDSAHAKYEKVLMTLPLIYHNTPDAEGNYVVKAVKYKLYSGSAPDKIEVEEELAWDSDKWLDQTVNNSVVSALGDNYRNQWNGTLTYRLDCATYPAYVKAEAYDEFNRLIAMGQYYTYAYSVRPEHEDILDHQPTFALVDNADGATYTFTAKHISAARAYAKKLSWKILNDSNVVAEGATAEVGVAQNPALVDASWIVDATLFEAGNEYSVEYTIDYMPVLNSAEMGEPSPLDYDPATGIFTPALDPDPEKATGMTHDARILRDYVLDENGKIKYRVNAIENTDDKTYMHVAAEGYTYRYLNHWNYNHCDPKVVTITSQDMLDAHSSMKAPAVVAPVLTGTLAEYDMKLVADVDEGTTPVREYFRSYGPDRNWAGYTDWNGLRSVNGIYQGAKVSWNHTGAYKISKVVINGIEVTADGENKWSVDDKFVGSYVIEGLTTSPATIDVKVYSGEELLAEKSIEAAVYTLPEQAVEVPFEIVYNEENLGWRITADKFATKDYGVLAASFNVYEKGSDTPLFTNNVVKNGNGAIANYLAWFSRGFVYTSGGTAFSVTSGDWDDNCTEEFSGGTADTFSGLKANTEYEIRYELKVIPVLHNATYGENTESAFRYDKALSEGDQSNFWGAKTLSGKTVVTSGDAPALALSANATIDAVELSWNPVTDATFEVYVGGEKVGETTETSYTYTVTNTGKYDFEVKVAGKALSATASATVEYLFASYWTAPKFSFDGKRMLVSDLANISAAGGCGYAYGGAITNDNDTSKSTIEIYKDGKLLYTLTNGTGQSTLTAWAGYGRWALNAQENRKDWIWTKADGNKLMEGETDVPAGTLTNGTYTLKWTIGYVVNKNANWATAASDNAIVATKAEATMLYFGPKDVKPSPNVAYTNDSKNAVKIMTKTGETTLTIGNSEPGTDPEPGVEMDVKADVAGLYQGAKLTWGAVNGASTIQIAYTVAGEEQLVEVAGDATEYTIAAETLNDAYTYDFVVTALNADEDIIGEGEVSTEVFTMFNYEAPELNLNKVEGGYQVVVGNLVEKNYAYVGGTLEFYKGEEKVYTLVNKTSDSNLNSWAGYGRWALNAMNNRKDWTWNDEGKEVNTHAIAAGDYTVKYTIEYAVNKNGTWATHNGSFVPQENEEGATYVYFANGKSDVLYDGSNAKRIVKSGEWTATVEAVAEIIANAAPAGYQNAKLTWNEIDGAASYKVATTGYESEAITATEFTIPANTLTDANKYKFTVTAYDSADAAIASDETDEIQIFTLANRPEPVVTLADGVLTLANAEINPSATKKDNLHIYGAALEAEIYFYKDGAATPAHTAKGTYLDSYPGANLALSYNEKKLKNNIAGAYTAWKWDGAAEATKTAPEFEAGVWTVKYKVGYHTFVNATYGSDRLVFTAPTDALQTMIYREGNSDLTFTVEGEEPEPEVLATLDKKARYIFKAATEMKGGKWYAIVYDNKAAKAVTGNYGYLKVENGVERATGISLPADCAFGFLTVDGGYTIQQYDNKYVYQTGTYDSFNVAATKPANGAVWTVSVDGGAFTITNPSVKKFVQYDTQYDSYGSYATAKGKLPTLYELVEVDNTPAILGVSSSTLSFAFEGETKEFTVNTYGSATLSASDDADWLETTVSGNTVSVVAVANSGDAREAKVTVSYGDATETVTVSQGAYTAPGETTTYTDELVSSMFKATSTTYTEFSGVAGTNGAVYAGKTAKSQNGGYIQLRSSKSEDGLVTTATGGKVRKVVIEWDTDQTSTTGNRTLDVYVSNTAFTKATQLYNVKSDSGITKAGGITCGTATELEISGDYDYVGLRSNNGAMYIKKITITYEK